MQVGAININVMFMWRSCHGCVVPLRVLMGRRLKNDGKGGRTDRSIQAHRIPAQQGGEDEGHG